MEIAVKKLTKTAQLPRKNKTEHNGTYALYADLKEAVSIPPGKAAEIPTGLAVDIPDGYIGLLFIRKKSAFKDRLQLMNGIGFIRSDCYSEITILIKNDCPAEMNPDHLEGPVRVISPGDHIAQLVIVPCVSADFYSVDEDHRKL